MAARAGIAIATIIAATTNATEANTQWHGVVPESVNVWPAMGTNFHA